MEEELNPLDATRQVNDLEARLAELRLSESLPDVDHRWALTVALEELGRAVEALKVLTKDQATAAPKTADDELRIMRSAFNEAPIPLFLMDSNATVRRVNHQAAALIDTSPGYVAGKSFPMFCDLQTRITLRSQLNAIVRSGSRELLEVTLLGKRKTVRGVMAAAQVWVRGDPDPLIVAAVVPVTGHLPAPRSTAGAAEPPADRVAALTHRLDVQASVVDLMLEGPLNESVAVRRCATVLAEELADWVIIDIEQDDALRRKVVFGPDDDRAIEVRRTVERLAPARGTLPDEVYRSGEAVLHSHIEDLAGLGVTGEGVALSGLMGAASLICVPVRHQGAHLGAITLAAGHERGFFELVDLGLAQRIGHHLALVIEAARAYQRRSEVAQALQASLLPRELPTIPGLEIAGRYLAATQDVTVGGDFYDVFPTQTGWGFVLGDVSGKGEQAAAVTATVRHGVRLLSRWKDSPAEIMSMVNENLMSSDRFVTAILADVVPEGHRTTARVTTAGHPPAVLVRSDGIVRLAGGGGVPLGLFDDFECSVETYELDEGDTLFLHSDGLIDACDATRERFGQEHLVEVLTANAGQPLAEVVNVVEKTLMDFCGRILADDLSMLALRVLPQRLE